MTDHSSPENALAPTESAIHNAIAYALRDGTTYSNVRQAARDVLALIHAQQTASPVNARLLPCPFCGKPPRSEWYGGPAYDDGGYWSIECCCAFAHEDDEETAAKIWNTRNGIHAQSAPDREAIARIIDINGFVWTHDHPVAIKAREKAFAKADAILALTSPERPKCKLCGLEDGACICAHIPAQPQRMPEGYVLVPQAALDWLNGEKPDADGKWFGECEDEATAPGRIFPRKFWWRSKFRELCALSRPECGDSQ